MTIRRLIDDHKKVAFYTLVVTSLGVAVALAALLLDLSDRQDGSNEPPANADAALAQGPVNAGQADVAEDLTGTPASAPKRCDELRGSTAPPSPISFTDDGLGVAIGVANVTCRADEYDTSTQAWVDDVIKVQLWYGSYGEEERLDDVAISFGLKQDAQRVEVFGLAHPRDGQEASDSSYVDLSLERAALSFIPGSAMWRHNVTPAGSPRVYETESVPDHVFLDEVLVGRVARGSEGEGTLSALFRVVASVITIDVEMQDGGEWVREMAVSPDVEIPVRITLANQGNETLRDLLVGLSLAPGLEYVDDTLALSVGGDDPRSLGDRGLLADGVDVGDAEPGEHLKIYLTTRLSPGVEAGAQLRSVAWVQPLDMNAFHNTAAVTAE